MLRNHDMYFPKVYFSIGTWARKGTECVFAACAVGSAALWLPFRILGLKHATDGWSNVLRPKYKNLYDWSATQEFFGLTNQESYYLFDGWYYKMNDNDITPDVVADRIELFLKEGYNVAR